MRKYIYLFSIVYSFITFMIGWNDYQELGIRVFNIGMMAITAFAGLFVGYDWAKQQDAQDEAEWLKRQIKEELLEAKNKEV